MPIEDLFATDNEGSLNSADDEEQGRRKMKNHSDSKCYLWLDPTLQSSLLILFPTNDLPKGNPFMYFLPDYSLGIRPLPLSTGFDKDNSKSNKGSEKDNSNGDRVFWPFFLTDSSLRIKPSDPSLEKERTNKFQDLTSSSEHEERPSQELHDPRRKRSSESSEVEDPRRKKPSLDLEKDGSKSKSWLSLDLPTYLQ